MRKQRQGRKQTKDGESRSALNFTEQTPFLENQANKRNTRNKNKKKCEGKNPGKTKEQQTKQKQKQNETKTVKKKRGELREATRLVVERNPLLRPDVNLSNSSYLSALNSYPQTGLYR